MTRTVDFETMPTRTKTNPQFAAKRGERTTRSEEGGKGKWPKRTTIKHEKIGQHIYDSGNV